MGFDDELKMARRELDDKARETLAARQRKQDKDRTLEREFQDVLQRYAVPAARQLADSVPKAPDVAVSEEREHRKGLFGHKKVLQRDVIGLRGWHLGYRLFLGDDGRIYEIGLQFESGRSRFPFPTYIPGRRIDVTYFVPEIVTTNSRFMTYEAYSQFKKGESAWWQRPDLPEWCVVWHANYDDPYWMEPIRSLILRRTAELLKG